MDLVGEKIQLYQAVQALEGSVMHDGDVVPVNVQLGQLGQVRKHVSVDLRDVVFTEGERVKGGQVREGVASQCGDGVP